MIVLYDLCGADKDIRFGPWCWLVKFALLHKGLAFDIAPLGFAEKQNYPDPDYGKLPMIKDAGVIIRDSAAIAAHLDAKYKERPLVATDSERAAAAFYRAWASTALFPALRPFLVRRIWTIVSADDRDYVRRTREAQLGMSLEDYEKTADPKKVEAALSVLAAPLGAYPFLGGREPNLCDYTIAAPLFWRHTVTSADLYETPAPVAAWFERLLDLYDGYARKQKRAA